MERDVIEIIKRNREALGIIKRNREALGMVTTVGDLISFDVANRYVSIEAFEREGTPLIIADGLVVGHV